MIPRVSRHIDKYCKRFFYPKDTTYTYDFQSTDKIWLREDLQSLTGITNGDGTAIDLTKLFLYPLNGPPYQWIEFNQSSSQSFRWGATTDQQCILIEGVWGYLEDDGTGTYTTPLPIQDACSAWISYILKVGSNAGIKSTTIGDYTVSYSNVLDYLRNGPPNEASYYLDNYVKRRFGTTNRAIAP
jgi:hypothetical protein